VLLPAVPPRLDADADVPPPLVAAEADLPVRFLLGDRVAGSFVKEPCAWSARYALPFAAGGVDLTWRAEERALQARMTWHGETMHVRAPDDSFVGVLRAFGGIFPPAWDAKARQRVEAAHLARWRPVPRFSFACFFPDGWLRALVLPIPVSRLRPTAAALADVARRGECAAGVDAGCVLLHLDGLEARAPGEPPAPASWWAYVLVARVFFRDLEPLLATLAAHGVLQPRPPTRPPEPGAPALLDEAVILPLPSDVPWTGRILVKRQGEDEARVEEMDVLEGRRADVVVSGASLEQSLRQVGEAERAWARLRG
jgi:hypothetical protein